ncbi:ATP-binding protein [Micromonospora sp. GCM10011542]|uniref:ATP-binding protein n=1 Tax=Micromonospora sp. GCM10011542 TaxID=3317337 RepID=UPI00360C8AEF
MPPDSLPPPSGPSPGVQVAVLSDLPNAGTACAQGRHFVEEQLWRWRVPMQVADTMVLLASEIIANAVRHGPPPVCLELSLHADRVRLEVTDSSATPPVPRRPELEALGGRGLFLIDTLAAKWGWHPRAPGKVVWCEMPIADPVLPPTR